MPGNVVRTGMDTDSYKANTKKLYDVLNYTQLLLTYNLLEETHIHDVTINNILVFFLSYKKSAFLVAVSLYSNRDHVKIW